MRRLTKNILLRPQGRHARMPGPNGYRTGQDGQVLKKPQHLPVECLPFLSTRLSKPILEHDARQGFGPHPLLASSSYDQSTSFSRWGDISAEDKAYSEKGAFIYLDDQFYKIWPISTSRGRPSALNPNDLIKNWSEFDLQAVWDRIRKTYTRLHEFEVILRLNFTKDKCAVNILPRDASLSSTSLHCAYARLKFDADGIQIERVWDNLKSSKKAILAASYLAKHPQVQIGKMVEPLLKGRPLSRIEDESLHLKGEELDEAVAEYLQAVFYEGVDIKRGTTQPLTFADVEDRLRQFNFGHAWMAIKQHYPHLEKYSFYIRLTLMPSESATVVFTPLKAKKPRGAGYMFLKIDMGVIPTSLSEAYKQDSPESEMPEYLLHGISGNYTLYIPSKLFKIPKYSGLFNSLTDYSKRHETFSADKFTDLEAYLDEEQLYQVAVNYINRLFHEKAAKQGGENSFTPEEFEELLQSYDFLELWQSMIRDRPGFEYLSVDISVFMHGAANRFLHFVDPNANHPSSESYGFVRLLFLIQDDQPLVIVQKIWNNFPGTAKAKELDQLLTSNPTVHVKDEAREFIQNPTIMGHNTDFENTSLKLSGLDLLEAACVYLKSRFMEGLQKKYGKWPRLDQSDFEARWQNMSFNEIWQQMQKMRPKLGPMSVTVRFYYHSGKASLDFKPTATANHGHSTYTYARIQFYKYKIVLDKIWDNRGKTRNRIFRDAKMIATNSDLDVADPARQILAGQRPSQPVVSKVVKTKDLPFNLERAIRIHFMEEFLFGTGLVKLKLNDFISIVQKTDFKVLWKRLKPKLKGESEVSLALLIQFQDGTVTVQAQNDTDFLPPNLKAAFVRLYLSDDGCVVRDVEDNDKNKKYERAMRRLFQQNSTLT